MSQISGEGNSYLWRGEKNACHLPYIFLQKTQRISICSFFSAARRTNQEAPPLLSGLFARSLLPPSGAAELASLRQSSPYILRRQAPSRPDKGGFPCRKRLPFSQPLRLRHLPYILLRKTQGRSLKSPLLTE